MQMHESDIRWLASRYPNLYYEANPQKIVGELDFCAVYDNEMGKLIINPGSGASHRLIRDVFEVEICLRTLDRNGWPKVYEVGGRHGKIAKKCNVKVIDLHFYSEDDSCCLGLKYGGERNLRLKAFLEDLVIPFFYRLAYTDQFGITASRRDLWEEYSHGAVGLHEHCTELFAIAQRNPGRNEVCPCGSGKKYKKCHLSEVDALRNSYRPTRS